MMVTLLKTNGHGTLNLGENNPIWEPPMIHTNYLAVSKDLEVLIE